MTNNPSKAEFLTECRVLLAQVGIEASESMSMSKRIMVLTAIAELFPEGSPQQQEAQHTADALATAERCQLELSRFLDAAASTPNSPDTHP